MGKAYTFNQEEKDQLILLRDAYRDAANRLTTINKGLNKDCVLPLLFLYRHYLELAIKACLMHWTDVKRRHDLYKLYEQLTQESQERKIPFNEQEVDKIKPFLKELSDIDPEGINFRYPSEKFKEITEPSEPASYAIEINHKANQVGEFLATLENDISFLEQKK